MRRSEREITDGAGIDSFILSCDTCRLGFSDPEGAYIVPMSFGFSHEGGQRVFYFHGAPEGRKMDYLAQGHPAGFELDRTFQQVSGNLACEYSVRYQSVTGTGTLSLIEEPALKEQAINQIMRHYSRRDDWAFPAGTLRKTAVFKLTVTKICCKANR